MTMTRNMALATTMTTIWKDAHHYDWTHSEPCAEAASNTPTQDTQIQDDNSQPGQHKSRTYNLPCKFESAIGAHKTASTKPLSSKTSRDLSECRRCYTLHEDWCNRPQTTGIATGQGIEAEQKNAAVCLRGAKPNARDRPPLSQW